MTDSQWSGLAIAELAVAALTPLAVIGLGVLVARASRRVEDVRWANQTVLTRRMEIFTEVAPKLNKLLCFATFVGRWKEITPAQTIAAKRDLDEVMYANRPLFSPELFDAYHRFMDTYFAMYATEDGDALIRVGIRSVWGDRRNMPWWHADMASLFTGVDASSGLDQVQAAYDALAAAFRADLYVTRTTRPLL